MPTPPARHARVLSIGWFGEANLGDEAMLEGLLRLLERSLGPVEATVSSGDPAGTTARHGVRAIRRRRPEDSGFRDLALVRASLRADLVTLGGGDLLREQADGVVPARNWLSRLRVPRRLGRPTALLGVSVGELVTPAVVEDVARAVREIDLVAARDEASARQLRELSGREVHLMGDLALEALDPAPRGAGGTPGADGSPGAGGTPGTGGTPRIGVATRAIHGRGPGVPADAGARLEAALAAALDRVVEESGARIELVPFRSPGGRRVRDDDARAGEALAARASTGERWLRHPSPPDAGTFAALASGLDLVLSVRLHGAILGAAAGRPVVGIAYDPKVDGFLADLGLPEQALPLDAGADEIASVLLRSLARPDLPDRVRAGVERMRGRTRALEPLIARAAGRRAGR